MFTCKDFSLHVKTTKLTLHKLHQTSIFIKYHTRLPMFVELSLVIAYGTNRKVKPSYLLTHFKR